MKRIIVHWTGGSYVPSSLDKEHYHFLIDNEGVIHAGKHPILANETIKGKTSDEYAAHTLNTNTGSIGISLCAAADSQESPFKAGKYPVTKVQFDALIKLCAKLSQEFGIEITDKTLLSHAEVQANLGIKQRGKWDISHLTFRAGLETPRQVGDYLRYMTILERAKI